MSSSDHEKIGDIALVNEQRTLIRSLSGFRKKNHKVPDECNDRTQAFVAKLANEELGEDLDARFAEFRKHLGFKRVDLAVSDPDCGTGVISTPWFEYRITVAQATDDATEAIFRRQVTEFRKTASLLSSEFATVFGKLFNTVELAPPEPIDIEAFIDSIEDRENSDLSLEFDRSVTWCQLTTPRIPGILCVETDCVALTTPQPELPSQLLEAFFSFRDQLTGIECF